MNIKFVIRQFIKMGVQNLFLPVVYRFCKKRHVNKNCIVFADAHHEDMPFSMRCLYQAVKKNGMHVVMQFSDYGKGSFLDNLKNMLQFMRVYANAGYVVVCDNFLPAASCKKRSETKVIQLWHGCGALKKFGYDTPEDIPSYYKGNVLRNCDCVTVSAPWCVPYFASAMALPQERIMPLGISRTDLYYRPEFLKIVRKRFQNEYPQAAGKKVLLWAPTFRGNAAQARVCGQEAIDRLAQKLGEEWCVIKCLHPHMRKKLPKGNCLTAEELLPVTDLLITDYSSILFDYLIFQKPLVRFVPDYQEYCKNRGFYMDYETLPGAMVESEDDLYAAVVKEAQDYDKEALKKTFEKYMSACDGHATERIMKWLKEA
ncbi:MAG: CDP-glycerol glycerophosphotransferase family protein [Marvinbryantia sp.]